MDTAQLIATSGISVGIIAILFGIFALMWQMNRQSTRLETKIDAQGKELEAKIDAQGKELEAKIDAQSEDIREQGRRVSQAELEQARLNGVNSVLAQQIHSHGNLGDAD